MTKLRQYYDSAIGAAIAHVAEQYVVRECAPDDLDFPPALRGKGGRTVKVDALCAGEKITAILWFPGIFPDALPKVYLSKQDHGKLGHLPHVDSLRFVCTRDPAVVAVSDEPGKPGQAALEILHLALDLIERGLKGENQAEMADEVLAYWSDRTPDNLRVLMACDVPDTPVTLKLYKPTQKIFGCEYLAAGNHAQAEAWVRPLGAEIDSSYEGRALFLPLPSSPPCEFKSNRDALALLEGAGEEVRSCVERFYNESQNNLMVIVCFSTEGSPGARVLAGWRHTPWPEGTALTNGFRDLRHLPLDVRLARTGATEVDRVVIERMDRERLCTRTGTVSALATADGTVAIVGCGSLGSHTAILLAGAGVRRLCLIDNDGLESENVLRHACGASYAAKRARKVGALADGIRSHLPHVACETHDADVLELLAAGEPIFDGAALVVVAVGSVSVERRLNALTRQAGPLPPLLYAWIEPCGVAGHVMYVRGDSAGCWACCFDGEARFLHRVVRNPEKYPKREAGCQSTYVPYMNLDVQELACVVVRVAADVMESRPASNLLVTWLGDLSRFEREGGVLEDEFVMADPFTTRRLHIMPNPQCRICGRTTNPS